MHREVCSVQQFEDQGDGWPYPALLNQSISSSNSRDECRTTLRRGDIVHVGIHNTLPTELTAGHRLTFATLSGHEDFAANFDADFARLLDDDWSRPYTLQFETVEAQPRFERGTPPAMCSKRAMDSPSRSKSRGPHSRLRRYRRVRAPDRWAWRGGRAGSHDSRPNRRCIGQVRGIAR